MFHKKEIFRSRDFLNKSHTSRCEVCDSYGCDPDHIKTKASGGSDLPHNIMNLCRKHHSEKGQMGISKMCEKYFRYKNALVRRGWYMCEVRNKWVNDIN